MSVNSIIDSEVVDIHGSLSLVLKGEDGESAYEVAVRNGFVGTEEEWLNSLKGEANRAEAATAEALVWRNSAKAYAVEAGNHEEAAKGYRNECQTIKDGIAPQVTQAITAIQAEKAEAEAKKALVDEAAAQAHLDRVQADADAAEVRYLHGETVEQKNIATDAAERARRYAAREFNWEDLNERPTTRDDFPITDVPKVDGTDATGTWNIDISGDAATVNGHTVEKNVPSNAKFTDTTYETMTAQEASAGTSTTGRLISSKVMKDYVAGEVADLVDSAPETLDTLNELAQALGDDPNFATTVANEIGTKLGKTETAVNAAKVNNLTVETAVPAGAVFTDTTYDNATTSTAGLMSAADKEKLDGIASGAQVNSVTGVKGNSESSYRTGNVNITKANIGLGNVDNTADNEKSVAYAANAGTVNNHAVDADVPSDAKFTDTKYSAMSANEATTGTATTARTITAKVLADYVAACIANLVNSAPATLDTLKELADALGDDPNFATTMTNALAEKLGKNETAKNAEKVNNLTVQTAVPANAVFTDTTYTPASAAPLANGTAAVGTSAKYAREDHVHPLQTSVSGSSGSCTGNAATATRATYDENGVRISTSYAPQAQIDYLANVATNSVSAAVSAKNDAETAKNQAQNIADGLVSIRDTAVDTSLAISGQAADSKTVGDKFAVIGATSETNNEYLCVWLDSANRVLFGVKADGSFTWQKGIPKVLKDELDDIKARLSALEG